MAHLLELIDQLPSRSRFRTALVHDLEYARAVVDAQEAARQPDDDGAWDPPYEEYDLHSVQLADLRALVVRLIDATLTGTNRKPSGIPRFGAPRTAFDVAREELRRRGYEQALTVFSPHAVP